MSSGCRAMHGPMVRGTTTCMWQRGWTWQPSHRAAQNVVNLFVLIETSPDGYWLAGTARSGLGLTCLDPRPSSIT